MCNLDAGTLNEDLQKLKELSLVFKNFKKTFEDIFREEDLQSLKTKQDSFLFNFLLMADQLISDKHSVESLLLNHKFELVKSKKNLTEMKLSFLEITNEITAVEEQLSAKREKIKQKNLELADIDKEMELGKNRKQQQSQELEFLATESKNYEVAFRNFQELINTWKCKITELRVKTGTKNNQDLISLFKDQKILYRKIFEESSAFKKIKSKAFDL